MEPEKRPSARKARGTRAALPPNSNSLIDAAVATARHAPDAESSEAAYQSFLADALALPSEALLVFRDDPSRIYTNTALGLAAVAAHRAAFAKDHPRYDWTTIDSIEPLALALIFADTQLVTGRSDGTIADLVSHAAPLRALLLASASSLAIAGHLPEALVNAIRAGHGRLDLARDCVGLAALFRQYPDAVKHRTPVTDAQIDACDQVGTRLLKLLKPKGSRKAPRIADESVELRHRFYTLLATRYVELRRVGAWIWVDDLNDHVPPLHSRELGPRGARPTDPPQETSAEHTKATPDTQRAGTQAGTQTHQPKAPITSQAPSASASGGPLGNGHDTDESAPAPL